MTSFTQRVKGNDGRMDLPTLTISASEGWLNQKDRFSANIAGSEQKNYTLLRQGELSYNHGNSKLAKYGVVYALQEYKEALVPRVYHSFKVDESHDALFVEYYFSTKRPDRELRKLISSGARMDGLLNIGYDEFTNISISLPTFSEQKQIVALLKVCDKNITVHQRKIEHLNLKKKALLQKLFPQNGECYPEHRFPGFTDAWEQRELSSLTKYIGTGKSRFVIKEYGEYAILGSTNVIGYDDSYDYDGNFILTARVGANAGQLYRYSGKVKITDNTVFLMSDSSQFIYYSLSHFDLRRLSFGTGQPLVKSSELQKLKLCVPVSKSEQEKIGEIFNNIDNIITLHQ